MTKIDFDEPNTSEWLKWRKKCSAKTQKVIDSGGLKSGSRSNLYKKQKDVYINQNGPFNGKCAYCESYITKLDDLDHFRPRNSVTDYDNNPILIDGPDGNKTKHRGYYWLENDWKNLLPACKDCNRITKKNGVKIGKGKRFPIKGKYAIQPGEEKNEIPLLINPVETEPQKHLEYENRTGCLIAVNKSENGQICIDVFGLNLRERLVENRKTAYKEAFNNIWDKIRELNEVGPTNKWSAFQKEFALECSQKGHTIARKAAYEHIQSFFP